MLFVHGGSTMKPTNEYHEEEKAGPGSVPSGARKTYAKPELIKLGSLRDVTMRLSYGGNDGGKATGPHGTKRGGNFQGVRCDP
jgi:hypothetical protein